MSERTRRACALALTIGFIWTDFRRLMPWFEAFVDKLLA